MDLEWTPGAREIVQTGCALGNGVSEALTVSMRACARCHLPLAVTPEGLAYRGQAPQAACVRAVPDPAVRPTGGDNPSPINHRRCHPCLEQNATKTGG
jgi:hypothetical protein